MHDAAGLRYPWRGVHLGMVVQLEGNQRISQELAFAGRVLGDVTVVDGGRFQLDGEVIGDVTVMAGGTAELNGRVFGRVTNQGGTVTIRGTVTELVDHSGSTVVEPQALILGRR
jgi:phage baseplate assembly protein gpV